jgi:iron complex transport system ATP-binding protein
MTLRAEHVSAWYEPGRPVLRDVSAAFEPGTRTAVLGPNGAGKSTLLRVLAGVMAPQQGRVTLDGADVAGADRRRLAPTLAYIAQFPEVAFAFTLREVVAFGMYAAARGPTDQRIRRALERVDLASRANDIFATLSAGQRQRAALARALAQIDAAEHARPGCVLLADEPVSAMDPAHALRTLDLLGSLADAGSAVVCVLHDLTLARRWASHVLLLRDDGTVGTHAPASAALRPDVLGDLYGVSFEEVGTGAGAVLTPRWPARGGPDRRSTDGPRPEETSSGHARPGVHSPTR